MSKDSLGVASVFVRAISRVARFRGFPRHPGVQRDGSSAKCEPSRRNILGVALRRGVEYSVNAVHACHTRVHARAEDRCPPVAGPRCERTFAGVGPTVSVDAFRTSNSLVKGLKQKCKT